MDKICGIYKITSPSKKVYIGQSIDILLRKSFYKRLACKSQKYLYHSLKKYGWKKHKFEILQICEPEQTNELEKYYIKLYQCFNSKHGLNLAGGGEGGGAKSEITKEKLRIIAKNRPPKSKETIRKAAESNRGKILSKESIAKTINSRRNNGKPWHTEETKRNISHKKQLQINGFIKINIEIECACGCGQTFMKYDKWRNERKYINGHNFNVLTRDEHNRFNSIPTILKKPRIPKVEMAGKMLREV